MTVSEDDSASQTSAAVVSVYNSWNNASDDLRLQPYISFPATSCDDDDTLSFDFLDENDVGLSSILSSDTGIYESPSSGAELLEQLKERCCHEDIPQTPVMRPRRGRPVCQFLNFLGTRNYNLPPLLTYSMDMEHVEQSKQQPNPALLPFAHDLGLDEKDALFPLSSSCCSSKVKHDDEDEVENGPATKRLKVDDALFVTGTVLSS